jgi:DNA-binding NarL/FixJ family response regulator
MPESEPEPERPPDGRLRVLVVDADDRVRESLAGLLAIGDRVAVVGSAGFPGAALEVADRTHPDVVIIDPRLPDVDAGTALIQELHRRIPGTRILAMSWSEDLEHHGIDCGADGFVRKTFRPAELIASIVAGGRPAVA